MTVGQRLVAIREAARRAGIAHERAGVARGFPEEDMCWDHYERGCALLIGLITGGEGEAAFRRLEQVAAGLDEGGASSRAQRTEAERAIDRVAHYGI